MGNNCCTSTDGRKSRNTKSKSEEEFEYKANRDKLQKYLVKPEEVQESYTDLYEGI